MAYAQTVFGWTGLVFVIIVIIFSAISIYYAQQLSYCITENNFSNYTNTCNNINTSTVNTGCNITSTTYYWLLGGNIALLIIAIIYLFIIIGVWVSYSMTGETELPGERTQMVSQPSASCSYIPTSSPTVTTAPVVQQQLS